MGLIYRVQDSVLDRVSAMKVTLPALMEHSDYIERFISEARITSHLEHPNIVPVHDFGNTPDAGYYYTMKLVKGEALSRILNRILLGDATYRQKYDRHQLLLIFKKVCDAIAFAHAANIVHRDIKPENIMVGLYGEVFVTDWGVAKRLDSAYSEGNDHSHPNISGEHPIHDQGESRHYRGTLVGSVIGTPAYMSPEQASGRTEELDFRTDIFLLGATLFNIVTLALPYSGRSIEECVRQAAHGEVSDPHVVCPEAQIPAELCRIIRKAMAPDKADRYQTVGDLHAELDVFMSGQGNREQVHLRPGEFLFRANEEGKEGYIILDGKLEVFRDEGGREVRLGVLKAGDVVGEMAMLTDDTRSANVRALTPTNVERVTSEVIKTELQKLGPWIGQVVNSLADRLRVANESVHPLLSDQCEWYAARQILLLLKASLSDESKDPSKTPIVSREKLVREISQSLGIPLHRTETSLEKLMDANIIQPYGQRNLAIHRKRITNYLLRHQPVAAPAREQTGQQGET